MRRALQVLALEKTSQPQLIERARSTTALDDAAGVFAAAF